MGKIDRVERSHMVRQAREIRLRGHAAGWSVSRIVAVILREVPQISPLEARRHAFGWSRPEVIAAIGAFYRRAQLGIPAVNSSMLCRWEHGDTAPSAEYADALMRVYEATGDELGISGRSPLGAALAGPAGVARCGGGPQAGSGQRLDQWGSARAVRESVQLVWRAEGPGGGQTTREQLEEAFRYYDLNYGLFPPALLVNEVQECRAVVTAMLGAQQPESVRAEILHLAARFSALLGTLAYHVDDGTAAEIHLGTAVQLAAVTGCNWLHSWALGARSMLALSLRQSARALDLARRALKSANNPLRRAQVISWALLPACVQLGRHDEARDAMTAARRELDVAPGGGQPGRFGFDQAELQLHLAEAAYGMRELAAVKSHAEESLRHTTAGRPSWAAATLVLARGEAARGRTGNAASLGLHVLDTMPPEMLRITTWRRLKAVEEQIVRAGASEGPAADLGERLRAHRRQAGAVISTDVYRPSPA
jgi:tetratricopeptide (TPR) repeat protein